MVELLVVASRGRQDCEALTRVANAACALQLAEATRAKEAKAAEAEEKRVRMEEVCSCARRSLGVCLRRMLISAWVALRHPCAPNPPTRRWAVLGAHQRGLTIGGSPEGSL